MSIKSCTMIGMAVFWLLLLPWDGAAQGQIMSVKHFDESMGFGNLVINSLHQDRAGFLWIGTAEGLVRFDGHQFKTFRNIPGDSSSLACNYVLRVAEDPQGNIWVGMLRGGVSCYNRSTGKFRNYLFARQLKPSTASVVSLFFDRAGELWMGVAFNGLVHLDQQTGKTTRYDIVTAQTAPHLPPSSIAENNTSYNGWEDENGFFWLATTDDLYRFDPRTGESRSVRARPVRAGEKRADNAYSLLPDGDLLWVGGWASGLRCFNRKTNEWKQFFFNSTKTEAYTVNIVNDLEYKSEDELWVATQEKGLGVFNKKTSKFFFYAHDSADFPDAPAGAARILFQDRQQNLWLTHEAHSLSRIQLKDRPFEFHPVTVRHSDNSDAYGISCIFEDREGRFLFIGTSLADGLHVVDKKTGGETILGFETSSLEEKALVVVGALQDRAGTIWVLTRDFLFRFDPAARRLEKPVQPPLFFPSGNSNFYTDFVEDQAGNLWLSTGNSGLLRYLPSSGATVQFLPDENDPNAIAANVLGTLAVDAAGRLWYGSRNLTCYGYYLPAENRFVYMDENGRQTTQLATVRTNSLFADRDGNIWACTESGLLHYDCSGQVPRLLDKYTADTGLPSDYAIYCAEDDARNIWCTTHHGISRIERGTGKVASFGRRDGLRPPFIKIVAMADGHLFLPSAKGYFSFLPAHLVVPTVEVPIVLTSFKIDDREKYPASDQVVKGPLVVPAGSRFFSLEFVALDLAQPELFEYEYRLEGYDNDWVQAGSRRYVSYANLPTGHYIFKVKRAGGPADGEMLSVPVVVKVAFFETGWFWAAMCSLAAVFAAWLYRRRMEHEQKVLALERKAQLLEKEKAIVMYESLKQQLNPHFLFNSLTSLGSLIHIDPKAAAGFLDSLSKTYRYILQSSEVEVVPLREELKFAETFVKLQKTRFEQGLQVDFRVGEDFLHRKIVPVTLQNLLENAIKHNIIDADSPLVIEVWVEDGYLFVRNNLQKKKFVETSNRQGLVSLQSFYNYLSDRPIIVREDAVHFTVQIPLL